MSIFKEITPIHQAIRLDEEEPIVRAVDWIRSSPRRRIGKLNQDIEETPLKGRTTKPNVETQESLVGVKDDFHTCWKYEGYQETFEGRNSFSQTDTDATLCGWKKTMKSGQLKAATIFKSLLKINLILWCLFRQTPRLFCHSFNLSAWLEDRCRRCWIWKWREPPSFRWKGGWTTWLNMPFWSEQWWQTVG